MPVLFSCPRQARQSVMKKPSDELMSVIMQAEALFLCPYLFILCIMVFKYINAGGMKKMISPSSGFTFMIAVIIILILISIQFTLNMILRELKSIRIRLGADPDVMHRGKEIGEHEKHE